MSFEDIAIAIDGVNKIFEVYEHPRDQLKQFLLPRLQARLGLEKREYFRSFSALKNISLSLRKGEACGIVGLNGSGKSTLLQIITGTLSPTSGRVAIHGRIAALLELGSGFDPEFTGRENIFIYGAVMGFAKEQVSARMSEIEAFADIGSHIDQPVKSYSSGMQMRVAFAVATAFEPEILIVDEALAVGDAYFQQKCFHRIENFKKGGGTLLFVSHDANTVKHLCDRAILLSHGEVLSDGPPKAVIDLYQGLISSLSDMGESNVTVSQDDSPEDQLSVNANPAPRFKATTVTTNRQVELVEFSLEDSDGSPVKHIESETELVVKYEVRFRKAFDRPAFGLIVRDKMGRSIFETSTYAMRMDIAEIDKESSASVSFRFHISLRAGTYSFSVGVANRGFGRSEFEEMSLLMHDVEQIQVFDCPTEPFYGGVFNMKPLVSVDVKPYSHV